MRHRLFVTALVAILVVIGIPSYDERQAAAGRETADEIWQRVMTDCKYMFDVGTAGGAETMDESEE